MFERDRWILLWTDLRSLMIYSRGSGDWGRWQRGSGGSCCVLTQGPGDIIGVLKNREGGGEDLHGRFCRGLTIGFWLYSWGSGDWGRWLRGSSGFCHGLI